MFTKLSLAGAVLALSATALVPTTAASAQRYDRGYDSREYRGDYRDGYRQDYRQSYRGDERRYYSDRNYRARQKCNDGDGGTVIGAIAGGLLGRSVAGRGDHVLGTIIGGVGGALAGRAIDRSDRPNYCR